MRNILAGLLVTMVMMGGSAWAKTVMDAPAMSASSLSHEVIFNTLFGKTATNLTIEFKEGDRFPVTFEVQGEVFTTVDNPPVMVEVKKRFFARREGDATLLSWDGKVYQPLAQMFKGTIKVDGSGESEAQVDKILVQVELNVRAARP